MRDGEQDADNARRRARRAHLALILDSALAVIEESESTVEGGFGGSQTQVTTSPISTDHTSSRDGSLRTNIATSPSNAQQQQQQQQHQQHQQRREKKRKNKGPPPQ